MALTNLFKPKWKHTDPEVRLAEIRNINNPEILKQIVQSDTNVTIRETALEKLNDQTALCYCVAQGYDTDIRLAALKKVTDKEFISILAKNAFGYSDTLQIAAIEKETDDTVLSYIIQNSDNQDACAAATKRRKKITDAEDELLASSKKITVLDMEVPTIDDKYFFSRIVQQRDIPLGLSLSLDEFGSVYGELLDSVPNPGGGGFNPFFVNAENGPSRLFCGTCENIFSGSFIFGLTTANAFRGGVALGGEVKKGMAHACPKCGGTIAIIVYQPTDRK